MKLKEACTGVVLEQVRIGVEHRVSNWDHVISSKNLTFSRKSYLNSPISLLFAKRDI